MEDFQFQLDVNEGGEEEELMITSELLEALHLDDDDDDDDDDNNGPVSAVIHNTKSASNKAISNSSSSLPLASKEDTEAMVDELRKTLFTVSTSSPRVDCHVKKSQKPSAPPQSIHNIYDTNPPPSEMQVQFVVDMLAQYFEVGEEAAFQAAMLSKGDVNVAQHIVLQAQSAPPVCRHLLNSRCYRFDCKFSHDIENHSCIFWMKGRCRERPDECKFLHGFSDSLLENVIPPTTDGDNRTISTASSTPSYSPQGYYNLRGGPLVGGGGGGFSLPPTNNNSSTFCSSSSPQLASSYLSTSDTNTWSVHAKIDESWSGALKTFEGVAQTQFSYANVLLKKTTTSDNVVTNSANIASSGKNVIANKKSVQIPQELWNDHQYRDCSAFQISDPIERYHHVSQSYSHLGRNDIVDMHFQSAKTAPIVLEYIVDRKLSEFKEIWIVTGTGHHVSSRTHQKGGGILEQVVAIWLTNQGYDFYHGKDKNGFGGAILVTSSNTY